MRKHKSKFILCTCLLLMGMIWFLLPADSAKNDEQRFRQMVRAERKERRVRSIEQHLPLFLITTFRLEGHRLYNEELARNLQKALLTSGFLTNASLIITNIPTTATNRYTAFLQISRRFKTVKGVDYWSFQMRQTNEAMITCRPADLPRIRSRIEVP